MVCRHGVNIISILDYFFFHALSLKGDAYLFFFMFCKELFDLRKLMSKRN